MKIKNNNYKYRDDIDGLRCLAVLLVIFFHLDISSFNAGYIGVDIFFVISGYLIIPHLISQLENQSFSLSNFWYKRFKRIIPVYVFIVSTTTFLGYFILLPQHFKAFAKSVQWQSFFSSNFLFLNESGYFDSPSLFKPLLHTWSLSIEEQFYLVIPILFFVFSKLLSNNKLKSFLATLIVLSFLSMFFNFYSKEESIFFLPTTRFWEIGIGGLFAIYQKKFTYKRSAKVYTFTSAVGLFILVLCCIFMNPESSFPKPYALFPVLSTCLILFGNKNSNYISKCFKLKPFKYLGKISYSLYLWHWPIIVYSKYLSIELSFLTDILILLITTTLSILTFHFIEVPFRDHLFQEKKLSVFCYSISFLLILGSLGLYIQKNDGLKSRFSSKVQKLANGESEKFKWWTPKICEQTFKPSRANQIGLCRLATNRNQVDSKKILVWGNSHIGNVLPALQKISKTHNLNIFFPSKNCMWLEKSSTQDNCIEVNNYLQKKIKSGFFSTIILSGYWLIRSEGPLKGMPEYRNKLSKKDLAFKRQAFKKQLFSSLTYLRELNKKNQIYIVRPIPDFNFQPPKTAALSEHLKHIFSHKNGKELILHVKRSQFVNKQISDLKKLNIESLDPIPYLCTVGLKFCNTIYKDKVLYFDDDHLTVSGSELLEDMFLDTLATR